MKNVRTNMKNLVAVLAITLMTLSATAVLANGNEKKPATKKETVVDVKYLGKINDQPVLQVVFNNETEEEVVVILKDAEGVVLYSENFNGKTFSKKFMFQGDDTNNLQMEVVINTKKSSQSQSFSLSRSSRIVDEVVVSKL